jgi:non-ribosomal peptide synthetase-like protein
VSTRPTHPAPGPARPHQGVPLLVFGGEAVPPGLVERLWRPDLEVWNTYGPTETTVVACAALLEPGAPVRIGRALDGWDLAVVGPDGRELPEGEVGELVIGGVGVARYLDVALDAARFAPSPALGPARAYRTGDLVRAGPDGLVFVGRSDDQVKVNGRRIELGEVDAALRALPGVSAAAAAVRRSASGARVLVGYVVAREPGVVDPPKAVARLRAVLPPSMVPLVAVVDDLPTRTSGKVDRDALPWPLPDTAGPAAGPDLSGTAGWVAERWAAVLGVRPTRGGDDFFAVGGSSLAAAQLVSALRTRYPAVAVADVYDHPTVAGLADHLDCRWPGGAAQVHEDDGTATRLVRPVRRRSQAAQLAALVPLRTLVAARWLTTLAAMNAALHAAWGVPWAVPVSWWWVLGGWLLTVSPVGRMGISALGARVLLAGVRPGTHPRGGTVHLRLWAAQRLADGFGAVTAASAPWVRLYARALGARVGRDVDLHAVPPVTGMLVLGEGCAVEPEVDLSGCWVDGDVVHVGTVTVAARARVGARSILLPGARVGAGTDVAAGSVVTGATGRGEAWAGSPATRTGRADHPWPSTRPARTAAGPLWTLAYALVGAVIGALPVVAAAGGLAVVGWAVRDTTTLTAAAPRALVAAAVGALAALAGLAVLVVVAARLLGRRLPAGCHPVRSRVGVRAWALVRLTDCARGWLFPMYSSVVTPAWLRLLGARVGHGAEISTVVGLPALMRVEDGSFLADDALVSPYELGGGWIRTAASTVGREAFLGNSGMTGPGRKVPRRGLVAVLSAAPRRGRPGSSYLGSPPARLPRRVVRADRRRTYEPPWPRRCARAAVEALRAVPVAAAGFLALATLLTLQTLVLTGGWPLALALGGAVLLAAAAAAALAATAAKWLLVGRYRPARHPLWSAAVWRGELADTFTEVVAAPFVAAATSGTVALVWWLRGMGARIGRGVWCETYWLPEPDLVHLGDAASVGHGSVLQTHLFHDRVMTVDAVRLGAGATLGPNSIALPAAELAAGAAVGPGSLVLRGDRLPASSRWTGNPVVAWRDKGVAAE